MTKKSRTALSVENRVLRQHRRAESWALVAMALLRYGCYALIARYAFKSVEVLAGKATLADIMLGFAGHVQSGGQGIAWVLAALACVYGWRQRVLRQGTVERLGPRVKELERALDARRTSSGLTSKGDTHPEDQP